MLCCNMSDAYPLNNKLSILYILYILLKRAILYNECIQLVLLNVYFDAITFVL